MREQHWHVAIGHPDGAAYAISEYTDPDMAVRDFLRLSKAIYANKIYDPVMMEKAVIETAEGGEFCMSVGMDQPLMVVCTSCECEFLAQSN